MQITTETPSVTREAKKWHVETPENLRPLQEKYALLDPHDKIRNIDPKDVLRVINQYAQDLTLDTYSIAEIFNLSGSALSLMLKRDEFRDAWALAKKIRAEKALQAGLETASTPYDLLMQGKQIPGLLVKAATLKANYSLAYAKTLDPELNQRAGGISAGGDINIQFNNALRVKEFE